MRIELQTEHGGAVQIGSSAFASIAEVEAFAEKLFEAAFVVWPEAVPVARRASGNAGMSRVDSHARMVEFLKRADAGETSGDIADTEGIPAKTAANILFRARRLRKAGKL